MIIFILAYDPILRWIDASISHLGSDIFGMCDDLAIFTLDMPAKWLLVKIFQIVAICYSLLLNTRKTQLLFAVSEDGGDDSAEERDRNQVPLDPLIYDIVPCAMLLTLLCLLF